MLRRLAIAVGVALLMGCLRLPLRRGFERPVGLVAPEATRAALAGMREDGDLSALCARVGGLAVARFSDRGLSHADIGIAVIDLTHPARPHLGHLGGHTAFDAAQLVALAIGVEAARQRAEGTVTEYQVADLLARALAQGDPAATDALLDLLTGTGPGPTLIGPAFDEFCARRLAVQRTLERCGLYGNIVAHRVGGGERSGREAQLAERVAAPTNLMTPLNTARLLALIDTGQIVSGPRTAQLAHLMARAASGEALGEPPEGLPALWGLTAAAPGACHGAWVISRADGRRLAVAVMTRLPTPDPGALWDVVWTVIRGV